jgi:hypothetical protein
VGLEFFSPTSTGEIPAAILYKGDPLKPKEDDTLKTLDDKLDKEDDDEKTSP